MKETVYPMGDKEKAQDVLERVTLAIETMCVEKGDVRSRLKDALIYHLSPLREQDFPDELRHKFRKIMEQSTKYDGSDLHESYVYPIEILPPGIRPPSEGRIEATMRRIKRKTGAKIARDIWDLYCELRRIAERYDE